MTRLEIADGELWLDPAFICAGLADAFYNQLQHQLAWRHDQITLFGRQVYIPRLQCFQGDPGISYCYSGLTLDTETWHPAVLDIKQKIEALCGHSFNSVLINYYRQGQDSMGWHSDDEPELGRNPVIASVSLGQPRRFLLRHRFDKAIPQQELLLNNGSLLIMAGKLQHYWQHSVPKTKRPMAGRINLTFRQTETESLANERRY